MYIHQRKDWPNFTWDQAKLSNLVAEVRYFQGRLLGRMEEQRFDLREEATLETLTKDVVKTSEIEGEKLNDEQVRSSIARRLGIDFKSDAPNNRHVEGIVEVMLDAIRHYDNPLTEDRLFGWHAALFPTGRSGMQLINVGYWRTSASGPMQVVSGSYGRQKVHFEAPGAERLEKEMTRFIDWFNDPADVDFVIKSALAHFWFVTIHPFDDGNGRIARALADMVLARGEKSKQRFYSMSRQIQKERKTYYDVLEQCQKGSLNITPWVEWFLNCMKRAIISSEDILQIVLTKADFWKQHLGESFNERQRSIINLLFDGFEGKLTSSKWAKITKCSQDTALRDINDLIERQILLKDEAGGRSTNYNLLKDIKKSSSGSR